MQCDNPIIIGGSGSSGSTLLINILNNHSQLCGGPELSLLNKESFFTTSFEELQKKSKRMINKGMCTNGWFLYPKINFNRYGYKPSEISRFFNESQSQKQFLDLLFGTYINRVNKNIWVEKTPSNCYCFDEFEKLYPKARFIHIRRDGRDAISSLINRGMSPYFASMIWIYNTAFALRYEGNTNYYEIAYEDLVFSPEATIKGLCSFLEIKFEKSMLNSRNSSDTEKLASWSLDPNKGVSKKSVGKHKETLNSFHKFVIRNVSISKRYVREYNLLYQDFHSLQKKFGYIYSGVFEDKVYFFKKIIFILKLSYLFIKDVLLRSYVKLKYDRRLGFYPGKIFGI